MIDKTLLDLLPKKTYMPVFVVLKRILSNILMYILLKEYIEIF